MLHFNRPLYGTLFFPSPLFSIIAHSDFIHTFAIPTIFGASNGILCKLFHTLFCYLPCTENPNK